MTPLVCNWQDCLQWRILDTEFANAEHFLSVWQHWNTAPQRPQVLHYVALTAAAPSPADVIQLGRRHAELSGLTQSLATLWIGLIPGFHRFLLNQGQVVLTVCIGETLPLLNQQQFEADAVLLDLQQASNLPNLDWSWTIKALTRSCRRGTTLYTRLATGSTAPKLEQALQMCGFKIETIADKYCLNARYDPDWTLKKSRPYKSPAATTTAGTCAVIGAGLCGASVAAALARRGWQVRVFDQADTPACGASGLPVGLIVPHVSSDDCVLSQLSRAGVRMMLQQAHTLLKMGQDWAPAGTLERHIGATPSLPKNWPEAGYPWSCLAAQADPALPAGAWRKGWDSHRDIWHTMAAWIKPAQLVHAWLRQPGVQFSGNSAVTRLRQVQAQWELLNEQSQLLGHAERVVIANASGAAELLSRLGTDYPQLAADLAHVPAMHGMRGQLSWQLHSASPVTQAFPAVCVNGSGSLVCAVPTEHGAAWYVGSSYQPTDQAQRSESENHLGNWLHLQLLLPMLAQDLKPIFSAGSVNAWHGTRCITVDRLPAVGALDRQGQSGLWLCAGMGSRGLSFSVLCAELLAARWAAEPLPIEARLARSLEALRR